MRLFRMLSLNGIPRSRARDLIRAGRVTGENGPLTDGNAQINGPAFLDGEKLRGEEEVHLMMNKPGGLLTATRDERGQGTVMELLPERLRRMGLGPVGRLDKDATGLLILTTDGQLAHRLISPRWEEDKVYLAETENVPGEEAAERFRAGIELSDFTAKPALLEVLEDRGESALCRVTVREGKFHQVKRMLSSVGCPVITLKRVSVAGLVLDEGLESGQWRYLTDEEADALYKRVQMR